jgi:hypothetical protein
VLVGHQHVGIPEATAAAAVLADSGIAWQPVDDRYAQSAPFECVKRWCRLCTRTARASTPDQITAGVEHASPPGTAPRSMVTKEELAGAATAGEYRPRHRR